MSRKPESYWKQHIKKWEKSGLTVSAYAKKNGLVQSTLNRKVKNIEKQAKPLKLQIPENTVLSNEYSIFIESKNVRIKVPSTVDGNLLQIIMKELK